MGDHLSFPCSPLMDLQCLLPSSLLIGFYFRRQETGLELPVFDNDLELGALGLYLPTAATTETCPYVLLVLNY